MEENVSSIWTKMCFVWTRPLGTYEITNCTMHDKLTTTLGSSAVKAKPGLARPVIEAKPDSGMPLPDDGSWSLDELSVLIGAGLGLNKEVHVVVCRSLALPWRISWKFEIKIETNRYNSINVSADQWSGQGWLLISWFCSWQCSTKLSRRWSTGDKIMISVGPENIRIDIKLDFPATRLGLVCLSRRKGGRERHWRNVSLGSGFMSIGTPVCPGPMITFFYKREIFRQARWGEDPAGWRGSWWGHILLARQA